MNVRKLLVTDIRCHAEGCGAGPGESCNTGDLAVVAHRRMLTHTSRVDEHAELAAAGWQWQEVDPRDVGARGVE